VPGPPPARSDPIALLGPDANGDLPSRAPGPVDDDEVVRVGLGPDGSVQSVQVDQRLVIHGVGDFDLKVMGPATDVTAPPEQSPQPGLRIGTVIWQGFSAGRKELVSTVTLRPDDERDRLPLEVRVDGPGATIVNRTAVPIPLASGATDRAALAALSQAVSAKLAAGQAPVPGADGIPATLPARAAAGTERRPVGVPMHVTGAVGDTPFDVVVGDTAVRVQGSGPVRFTAVAALPAARPLTTVIDAQVLLASVARVGEFQVYAGVTVPGPSTARFEYAPQPPRPAPRPVEPGEDADWLAVGLTVAAALLLAGVAVGVWLRA
jgi:hypothetical protein